MNTEKKCVCVLSHQTLQKPGRSGDDDEELLGQLCDEGYFRALGTLIGLVETNRDRVREDSQHL